jgi:hypothetical protein
MADFSNALYDRHGVDFEFHGLPRRSRARVLITTPLEMSPTIQTFIALVLVAIAVVGLVVRARAKKKSLGCGGDCGCSSRALKTKSRG